jgi:protein TonB
MVEQRAIDVVVMRQEIPPASRPRQLERRDPPLKRFPERQSVPDVARPLPVPAPPKPAEKKEEPPSGGMGNLLDEQVVAQAAPGPAGGEGVGIAGVNVGGGMVGMGGGGNGGGVGSGGTGPGSGVGAGAGGPAWPADARFGDAGGPQIVYQEKPEYPFTAKQLQKEGKVSLALTIDEKGKLQKVEVLDATDQMFAASAVEAMKRSKFRPARRGGAPVACRAPYTIHFGF